MDYEIISLFGKQKSRGTFDDFFDKEKYDTLEQAYEAGDYVECNFAKDEDEVFYITATHAKTPEVVKRHRLNYQYPLFGLDVSDDIAGCELAASLM